MPHTVACSRLTTAGGDVSDFIRAIKGDSVVLAPTLAVKQGIHNASVRLDLFAFFLLACL